MSTFTHYVVFATEAEALAHADRLTEEKIGAEQRANGTTAYTAPMELEGGSWALQVEADVKTSANATRAGAVTRLAVDPFAYIAIDGTANGGRVN